VRAGEVMEYFVKPIYGPEVLAPSSIFVMAHGSRGAPVAAVIRNPAGRRK